MMFVFCVPHPHQRDRQVWPLSTEDCVGHDQSQLLRGSHREGDWRWVCGASPGAQPLRECEGWCWRVVVPQGGLASTAQRCWRRLSGEGWPTARTPLLTGVSLILTFQNTLCLCKLAVSLCFLFQENLSRRERMEAQGRIDKESLRIC